MTTSEPAQTGGETGPPRILSAAGSPASPSPSPGNDSHRRMNGGSGQRWRPSFAHYIPDTSSSRTCPDFAIPEGSSPEDAYAAGLIDGEGCLTITCSGRYYTARVEVGMTERALPVIQSMRKRYGGKVTKMREASPKWEAAWRWRVIGAESVAFVRLIKPLLRLKTEQADLILRLAQVTSSSPEAESLKTRINKLNLKGPQSAPIAGGHWVTAQQSLLPEWETFSGTWPVSGMTRNGVAYRLPTSAPPTSANASGSLPAPSATSYGRTRAAGWAEPARYARPWTRWHATDCGRHRKRSTARAVAP